jgi:hypothetical protein
LSNRYKISMREVHRLCILRDQAFHKQGGRCHWCGCEMVKGSDHQGHPQELTGDHVVPLWAGGKTVAGTVPWCSSAAARQSPSRSPQARAQGRRIETEAAPIRYVAEVIGSGVDSEHAIRRLIALKGAVQATGLGE